jgi:hypothetical protein
MDGIQILLIVVVVTLTMLLVIVGIQVLLIIFAIRRVIAKVDAMLEGKEKFEDFVTKERIQKVFTFIQNRLPRRFRRQ